MTTPLGGPSQLLVKCRNDSFTDTIELGEALELVGTGRDTDTGETILLVRAMRPSSVGGAQNKFIGVSLSSAVAGTGGGGSTGQGGYVTACVFGQVQCKVKGGLGFDADAVSAGGQLVAPGGTTGGGGRQFGILSQNIAPGTTGPVIGMALETGGWGSTTADQALTTVFLNGIGRHGFGT